MVVVLTGCLRLTAAQVAKAERRVYSCAVKKKICFDVCINLGRHHLKKIHPEEPSQKTLLSVGTILLRLLVNAGLNIINIYVFSEKPVFMRSP